MRRIGRFSRRLVRPASAPVAVVTNYAFTPSATPGAYITANPGGEAGSAGGFGYGVWLRVPGAVSSTTRHLLNRSNVTNAGYVMYSTGTFGTVLGNFYDGSGAAKTFPNITIAAGDVGKLLFLVHQWTGSVLRSYHNRAQAGADSAAITGFTAHSSAQGLGGTSTGFTSAVGIDILGGITWTGTPSLADVQALYDSIKTNNDLPTSATGVTVTHSWSVKRNYVSGLPATLTDNPGATNMSTTGTAPTLTTITGASWGW